MPKSPQKFSRTIKILTLGLLGIYVVLAAVDRLLPTPYDLCEYTKRMGGKEVVYKNEKYKVVLCGTGFDKTDPLDHIRMQILSESDVLLAQRKFSANWEVGDDFNMLVYKPDRIVYYDYSHQDKPEKSIYMPPTFIDWMRARIPLVD